MEVYIAVGRFAVEEEGEEAAEVEEVGLICSSDFIFANLWL